MAEDGAPHKRAVKIALERDSRKWKPVPAAITL